MDLPKNSFKDSTNENKFNKTQLVLLTVSKISNTIVFRMAAFVLYIPSW